MNNDLDEVNTISVTVRILKAEDTDFAAIPDQASVGDLFYGPEGQSQGVAITGLTSGMTIRDGNRITGPATGVRGEADAQNVVWLRYVNPDDGNS